MYVKNCEKTHTENFHWPSYVFTMCVMILHTDVSVGKRMFCTEVLDPVLGVKRICSK